MTPEVGLVGGMKRGVMPPQLRRATKGLACAALIVTHELSVAEYGADTRDSFLIVVNHTDFRPEPLTLLFRVNSIIQRRTLQEV